MDSVKVKASPIMNGFGRHFRRLLEVWMCCTTQQTFRSSVRRWRHKISKFVVEIFHNRKIRPQSCDKYFV